MAITLTNLTSGASTSNGASTASISPTASAPVYLAVAVAVDSAPFGSGDAIAVSGAGLTWTELGAREYGSRRKLRVFRGIAASPSPSAVTLTYSAGPGGAFQELMWVIDQGAGIDGTTPEGTVTTNSGSGTSGSVTVTGTPDADDFVYAAFAHTGASSNMTINGELSNEILEIGSGANVRRLLTAYDSTPDGSPTPGVSWTGSEDWGGIAFILNVAAGGGSAADAYVTLPPLAPPRR